MFCMLLAYKFNTKAIYNQRGCCWSPYVAPESWSELHRIVANSDGVGCPTNLLLAATFCRPLPGVFHVLRRRMASRASSIYSGTRFRQACLGPFKFLVFLGLPGRHPYTPRGRWLLASWSWLGVGGEWGFLLIASLLCHGPRAGVAVTTL